MSVVEPFLSRSELRSPVDDRDVRRMSRFRDVYDIENWNSLSVGVNYSTLSSWEDFMHSAPRNLITVNLEYGTTKPRRERKGKSYRQGCTSKGSWNRLVQFLKSKRFTVVRRVCINYAYVEKLTESEFHREVFGANKPTDSTVLFAAWRGLLNNRMHITNSGCDRPTAHMEAEPSKQIILDARKYRETFLRTDNYVSIFVRMEKAMQSKEGNVTYCFHQTLDHWRKMVSDTGMNTTFLSADIGRLGSDTYKFQEMLAFSEFFSVIYGNQLTVKQWEATFERVSSLSQSGYIAMLQKTIASEAKCVLFVGGGSFQRNALQMYRKRHAGKDLCIHIVESCTADKLQYP
jgi:hypothetical protein